MIKGIKTVDGSTMSIDEYLGTPRDYPMPILKAIMPNSRLSHIPNQYAVGEIIGCLRKSYFNRLYGSYETIDNLIRTKTGTAIHNSFLDEYDMKEKQMTYDFKHNGEKLYIKGKFDGYDFQSKTLIDLKTKQDVTKINRPYENNVLQLQCFATLAKATMNLQIEKLQVIYLDLSKIKPFEIPFNDQLDFMKQRTILLHDAVTNHQKPKEEVSVFCQDCFFNEKCTIPSNFIRKPSFNRGILK